MTDIKQKKTPIASEKLDAASRILSLHTAGPGVHVNVRNDLATVTSLLRSENERLGMVIKQGKQSVGGLQAKVADQARTIRGLEKRLQELESMVGK